MNFEIPKELNVSFTGGPDDKLSTTRLVYLKKELRDNPQVSAAYIRQGVKLFLPGLHKIINELPMGSHLLVMPSSSNTNRIPVLLATELKKLRPDLALINLKEKDIQADHRTEGKLKDNYVERSSDHRHFRFSDKLRGAAHQLNRAVTYILDDSISTGDTAVMLHRELGRTGIHAQGGILAAIAREKYHVRPSDLLRLYKTMLPQLPGYYPPEAFQRDLFTTFAGFPRKKLTNFERSYNQGKLSGQKENAFGYVQQVAHYLVAEKLDPTSVLHRQQKRQSIQQKPEVHPKEGLRESPSQKPKRGPKLF